MELTNKQKLERLAVIILNFRIWTGETILKEEDIRLGKGGELPPKTLASLGRKALINKERLTPFHTIRQRARRLIESRGVPFLGRYALDTACFKEIKPELDGLVDEFKFEIQKLVGEYDREIESWIRENPEYATSIKRDQLTAQAVEGRFHAGFTVNRVVPIDGEEQCLEEEVDGLYGTLISKINIEAKAYLKNSLAGVNSLTQRVRGTINSINEKLRSLAFLDSRISKLQQLIECELAILPPSGTIAGNDFWRIYALMSILADKNMVEKVVSNQTPLDVIAAKLSGSPQPKVLFSTATFVPNVSIPSQSIAETQGNSEVQSKTETQNSTENQGNAEVQSTTETVTKEEQSVEAEADKVEQPEEEQQEPEEPKEIFWF